jgi:hypothetical protein
MRPLSNTLRLIGAFQLVLGFAFLVLPGPTDRLLGLDPVAPGWARWLLAMMAARFLGYGYGMFWAARHPARSRPWVDSMIGIQVIDWIATIAAVAAGAVTLRQVGTAAFMPVVFVALLVWFHPARHRRHVGVDTDVAVDAVAASLPNARAGS